MTAEVWNCLVCRVFLQCCQPEGVSWSQLSPEQTVRLSSQLSRVWPCLPLGRLGREQCTSPGAWAQNSAEVEARRPPTIASPDCWARRRPGRRRRRSILLNDKRWTGLLSQDDASKTNTPDKGQGAAQEISED